MTLSVGLLEQNLGWITVLRGDIVSHLLDIVVK